MSNKRKILDFEKFRKEAETCQSMPLYTKNMVWEPVKLKNLHEFEQFLDEDQQIVMMNPANQEAHSTTYMYHINKDTKEDFKADVRDQDDKIIYEINGRGIFETVGGMKDKEDLVGLTKMLQAKNKIKPSDTIVTAEKYDGTKAGVQIAAPFDSNSSATA